MVEFKVEPLGMQCPGCDCELTTANLGGYRTLCDDCVDHLPKFPEGSGGYNLKGNRANFKWISADKQ